MKIHGQQRQQCQDDQVTEEHIKKCEEMCNLGRWMSLLLFWRKNIDLIGEGKLFKKNRMWFK
jgi:hypothetical protein